MCLYCRINPIVTPRRRISQALKAKVEIKHKHMPMISLDIQPVDEPTDWVNGLVMVENPNGKLRICLYSSNPGKSIW